jgi:hypothetical protein
MLDQPKTDHVLGGRCRTPKPAHNQEVVDKFLREIDELVDEFKAKFRTQPSDVVLAYFAGAEISLRRCPRRERGLNLLVGTLAAREWFERLGYSPTWTAAQVEDVFAALEGNDRDWCADWYENRTQ